jgi:hypothetical protein
VDSGIQMGMDLDHEVFQMQNYNDILLSSESDQNIGIFPPDGSK